MTLYAKQMIPKVTEAYRILARSDKRRMPSKSANATRAGCDHGTLTDWIERGWLAWAPWVG